MVKLARIYTMTVSPIIITRRQNEGMFDALKRVVDSSKTLIRTRHRTSGRVSSVGSAVILKAADMDNKGEVRGVYGGEQAVKALDALRRVARVANQSKLEGPILRMHTRKAERQGGSEHDEV
jgi:hypothetical protein